MYADDDATTADYDKEKALEALNMFRELSIDEQIIFVFIEGDAGYYFYALDAFIMEAFTANAADVAGQLLALEQGVLVYEYTNSAETLASIETAMAALKTAYEALEGEDKTSFAPLEEMYAYYISYCTELLATANA